jgi:NhaA family Na+:H+ antiporter
MSTNKFFKSESSGGILMIFATILAMILANSSMAQSYMTFINMPIKLGFGAQAVIEPLKEWVKDILMVFFFLLVGMELKCEMLEGSLSNKKQILLPLLAAIGGMTIPSIIFLLINHDIPQHWNGWAIPSATDIAFALCILTLVGKRVPLALKVFLLAIAIFDDLGAILIIALFYAGKLSIIPIAIASLATAALYVLGKMKIISIYAYMLIGLVLCFALYQSGIHTTIGGVIVGMAIPLHDPNNKSNSPLKNCIKFLHPWVNFVILPIFAFTAAGITLNSFSLDLITEPLLLGTALGLFIGKQIGIFGSTWLVVKSGFANLPKETNWKHIYGISIIAGIGFTMSIFINMLAFSDQLMQQQAKMGIVFGSLMAAIFGWLVLRNAPNSK